MNKSWFKSIKSQIFQRSISWETNPPDGQLIGAPIQTFFSRQEGNILGAIGNAHIKETPSIYKLCISSGRGQQQADNNAKTRPSHVSRPTTRGPSQLICMCTAKTFKCVVTLFHASWSLVTSRFIALHLTLIQFDHTSSSTFLHRSTHFIEMQTSPFSRQIKSRATHKRSIKKKRRGKSGCIHKTVSTPSKSVFWI